MKRPHFDERKRFDPADFPALREFLPAYLNEDYADEYGSALDAVKGFLADAGGDEVLKVKKEWKLFRKAFRGRPLPEIQRGLGQLGSAWRPAREADLQALDEILSLAEP